MIKYNKLFAILELRGMKRTDLLAVITSPTLARLGKNKSVSVDMIDRICEYLGVQPGDICEYVPDNK